VPEALFVFVLGVAVLTLWTKRPLVEGLPAAESAPAGLLLVAFPLTFAVRLHGLGEQGPRLLLFCAGELLGCGRHGGLFCGPCGGQAPVCPTSEPEENMEGAAASFVGSLLVGLAFTIDG